MSIMFPGLKPGAGVGQAGTPTAMLRSLGAPTNNLFQPIRSNGATGSNLSLSGGNMSSPATLQISTPLALNIPEERAAISAGRMGVVYADVGCQTDPFTPSDTEGLSQVDDCIHYTDDITAQTACEINSATADLELRAEAQQLKLSSNAVLAHQRSRSNEIDYSSARNAADGSINSQVSSGRAFRPVSSSSGNRSSTLFSDSLTTGGQPSSSRNGTSDSSRTLTPSSDTSPGRNDPIMRVSSEGRPALPSHWNREFATMSDYFTSDSNIEATDC